MPNHCYCLLKAHYHGTENGVIQKFVDSIKGEDVVIDFSKILPVPDYIFQGDLDAKAEKEHGENTWYKWNIKNWGTKWGAYETRIETQSDWKVVIRFTTAWSYPEPIINKIFESNQGIAFEFIAADDGGWFALRKSRDEEGNIETIEWTTEAKNDEGGVIRSAIFEAINTKY